MEEQIPWQRGRFQEMRHSAKVEPWLCEHIDNDFRRRFPDADDYRTLIERSFVEDEDGMPHYIEQCCHQAWWDEE